MDLVSKAAFLNIFTTEEHLKYFLSHREQEAVRPLGALGCRPVSQATPSVHYR